MKKKWISSIKIYINFLRNLFLNEILGNKIINKKEFNYKKLQNWAKLLLL